MQTLTYGRKKPDDGDKGSVFFDALEDNIDLNDAHDHDGVNSAKLPTSSLTKTVQSLLAAGWVVHLANTRWRQAVTLPAALTRTKTNGVEAMFKDSDTGNKLELSVEWISDTQFYVYANDPNLNLTVIYV